MGLFSTLGPLASFGLTAAGMPIAGAAAGGIFGALSAQKMREEQMRQRQNEMLANAESNRYSWARKSGQAPQVDVQPWLGEGVSTGAGAIKGLEQAGEFQKLFKKDKDVETAAAPAAVASSDKQNLFQRQVAGSQEPTYEMQDPEELKKIFSILSKSRGQVAIPYANY